MEDSPNIPSAPIPTSDPVATQTEASTVIPESQPAPLPIVESPPQPTKKPPLQLVTILSAGVVLLLVLLVVVFVQSRKGTDKPEEIVAIPTTAPTPTPIRKPSALSSTSAFMSFAAEKASFSAEINNFTFQEGLFTPPTLDLELGITD